MLTTILVVLGYIVFALVLIAGIVAAVVGLPGTTLILATSIAYSAITGWQRLPWWVLLILAVMALLAEGSDSFIAAVGTKAGGGSTKTSVIVVVGTVVGAIIGGAVLSPLLSLLGIVGGPIGFVLGVVLPPLAGGVAGGFVSAYYYEKRSGKSHEEAMKAGWGAFLGRMGAGLVKAMVGCVMIAIIVYTIIATAPSAG